MNVTAPFFENEPTTATLVPSYNDNGRFAATLFLSERRVTNSNDDQLGKIVLTLFVQITSAFDNA